MGYVVLLCIAPYIPVDNTLYSILHIHAIKLAFVCLFPHCMLSLSHTYIQDYDAFENAIECEELEKFLKL